MTERLYHQNSFLYNFTSRVLGVREVAGRKAIELDRTAFYPTSGGQRHDTGWLELTDADGHPLPNLPKLRVEDVLEDEATNVILHVVDALPVLPGEPFARGFVDVELRQEHMQQHSGQHVLSAILLRLFNSPTVSFHMGEETCTIDLDVAALSPAQLEQAELQANRAVWEDRQVLSHEVTPEQAVAAGVRKLPEGDFASLRLVEVRGVDLCACCGTHVKTTGQIGHIQLRKVEKIKQGLRVEFVCGSRALRLARKDYTVLTEAAALYSSHIWEVPAQTAKLLESNRAGGKQQQKLLEEIAELAAQQAIARTPEVNGLRVVSEFLPARDLNYAKLYAQKLVAAGGEVIALIGAGLGSPALVFAATKASGFDAGAALKSAVTSASGRGGGNREMAQGGVPDATAIPALLELAAQSARQAKQP
jgi:alanyl-tRNA synthetase